MQEKEAPPGQTAYSYSQPAFTEAALAPGQNSIGTGGQDWIGSNKRAFDALKYRARHLVENLFQRMKVYRRVATRYEKLDSRFLSIVYLVGTMKWLH